jgi:hypothetical protein
MVKMDVTDEAMIDSSPMEVYKAIIDEYSGVTNWWMPHLEFKPRENKPFDCESAICDMAVHGMGMTAKFSVKMTKLVEAKSIEYDYSGDFVGTGKWTFEPTDGKTKVQYRMNVRTNRLLFSLVAPFMKNPAKPHSDMMQKGFKALNSYLSKK